MKLRSIIRDYFAPGIGGVGVIQQFRPPQQSDFGAGGIDSPIFIDARTGEAFIYINGKIIPFPGGGGIFVPPSGGDDTQSLQDAAARLRAAGGGAISFQPGGIYNFTQPASTIIFDVSGLTGVVFHFNGATFKSSQVNPASVTYFIYAPGVNGLWVDSINFIGGNTGLSSTTGEKFLIWGTLAGVGARNITIVNASVKNCLTGPQCLSRDAQSTGVVVLNCYFEKCFYPLNVWGTDDLTARITTRNCGRSYFPVNPGQNHDVWVDSASGFSSVDCLIKVYSDSTQSAAFNTLSNIALNYVSRGKTSGSGVSGGNTGIVACDFQQVDAVSSAGHFRNISINVDLNCNAVDKFCDVFGMNKYDFNGNPDATARGHTFDGLKLTGTAINWDQSTDAGVRICDASTGDNWTGDFIRGLSLRDLTISGAPPNGGILVNGQGAVANVQFLTIDNVRIDGTYTESNIATTTRIARRAFTASGLDDSDGEGNWTPSLGGNATYTVQTGTWKKEGKKVTLQAQIVVNAIGTGSTGQITGVPFAANATTPIDVGFFANSVTAYTYMGGFINATTITLAAVVAASASMTQPAVVFQNGTNIVFTVTYFVN